MEQTVSKEEVTIAWAVSTLCLQGIYPSAQEINDVLDRRRTGLNGRECKFRTELFKLLGIKKQKTKYN